jgi:hypothetical protein
MIPSDYVENMKLELLVVVWQTRISDLATIFKFKSSTIAFLLQYPIISTSMAFVDGARNDLAELASKVGR